MTLELDGSLVLIGAGKMGGALLLGMLKHGIDNKSVVVQDPAPPSDIKTALAKFNVSAREAPAQLKHPAAVVILAVKPQLMAEVLPDAAKNYIGASTLVISIAAGLTLSGLEQQLPKGTQIVRAMPNTPASIGHGMIVCVGNTRVSKGNRTLCDALLKGAGETAWLDNEADMDAVTALSGSGPAYVFLLAECMAQAGIDAGLEAKLAHQLARETIAGAGALMKISPEDTATLRTNVTSKAGTTAAALEQLMSGKDGLQSLLSRAITAAINRSREMAKGD